MYICKIRVRQISLLLLWNYRKCEVFRFEAVNRSIMYHEGYHVRFLITGFALGSVEGRVAIQYVNPSSPKDNFTFKCHRTNGATGNYQDIYAVSSLFNLFLLRARLCPDGVESNART